MSSLLSSGLTIKQPIKRKIFVSYHHGGDQQYYNEFARIFGGVYQVVADSSLDRRIDSENVEYVMRRIREHHITGSSCTVVLCGTATPLRKYVDWEISASLDKSHGVIGVKLPSLTVSNDACDKPARLQDNIDSGYAKWTWWEHIINSPARLADLIEEANASPKRQLDNTRSRRLRNG